VSLLSLDLSLRVSPIQSPRIVIAVVTVFIANDIWLFAPVIIES
jgi:hypothetical protein